MSFVVKPADEGGAGSGGRLPPEDAISKNLPALFEYLSMDRWDGGAVRVRATLMAMIEDGKWKVCLNDREHDRSCWVAADSLQLAFVALDQALAGDTAEWRKKTPWGRGGGKR